jgi:hypothetical protein
MKHRMPRLLFVALCCLAPALLGHFLHWSAWLWAFMSMVTTSGSLLLVMTGSGGGHAQADGYGAGEAEPPAEPVEPPFQETRVVDVPLSSAAAGYDFLFSATVWWKPVSDRTGRSDAFPALAASSVVSRALEVVRHEEPGRAGFARCLLEGQLGLLAPDLSGRVAARAADVTLTISAADRERLRKLSDLRKDEEVWEYERQHERNKRRYLGDDVLKSAGSAVVWWLARHEDEIERAVHMIGPLAQVAAAANDEEVPEFVRHLLVPPVGVPNAAAGGGSPWDGVGEGAEAAFGRESDVGVAERLRLLLAGAGLKPDMDGYTVLAHRVMRFLRAEGLDEAADEIVRVFGLAPDGGAEDSPLSGGGPWPPSSPAPEGPSFSGSGAGPDAGGDSDSSSFWAAETGADPGEEDGYGS